MENRKKLSIIYGYMSLTIILGEAFFGFGFTAFMSYRGVSIALIGVLSGIADFSMMIFDYPMGNLADKYGRKKLLGWDFLSTVLHILCLPSPKVLPSLQYLQLSEPLEQP